MGDHFIQTSPRMSKSRLTPNHKQNFKSFFISRQKDEPAAELQNAIQNSLSLVHRRQGVRNSVQPFRDATNLFVNSAHRTALKADHMDSLFETPADSISNAIASKPSARFSEIERTGLVSPSREKEVKFLKKTDAENSTIRNLNFPDSQSSIQNSGNYMQKIHFLEAENERLSKRAAEASQKYENLEKQHRDLKREYDEKVKSRRAHRLMQL